jgi:hypothetical protein
VLGIVTLQQEVAGAAEGSIAYTLAAIKDWTFLLGPGWVVGWGNGLILGYLMYSSGWCREDAMARPRRRTAHHRVGHPRHVRRRRRRRHPAGPRDDPRGRWELFLGIYCTVKGFRPSSPILRADTRDDRRAATPAVSPA